jgi:DNA-binding NarL/FixJ family response regulator
MTYRLLLTDDDPLFMAFLRLFVESDERFVVVGTATNGQEAVELAAAVRPDVVLMDIDMPVMDGVDASRRIHEAQPQLPIVLVSASQFEDRVANAWAAGATGYVQKHRVTEDLISTILAVVAGGQEAGELMWTSLGRARGRQSGEGRG